MQEKIFRLWDFKINMEFWTMEMKKMWIEIFQLKRSFIVPDLLFSYNASTMRNRSRRILFTRVWCMYTCFVEYRCRLRNEDTSFRKEIIEHISKVLLFSLTCLYPLTSSTNFSTLHAFLNFISRFLLSDSIDSFARAHSILNGILRIVATS